MFIVATAVAGTAAPETVTVDAHVYNTIMIVMYGIFSLAVIVVGAYIALFKRSIENQIKAGFDHLYSKLESIEKEVEQLSEQQQKNEDRLINHITDDHRRAG